MSKSKKLFIFIFTTYGISGIIFLSVIIIGFTVTLGYFTLISDYEFTYPTNNIVESNEYTQGSNRTYNRFPGVFMETPGQPQGAWSQQTLRDMSTDTHARQFQPYWGTSYDLQTDAMKDWRENSRWGVPFYYQRPGKDVYPIKYGLIRFDTEHGSLNGCAFHMSAYIASALTGDMINVAEMASALIATNGVDSMGRYRNHGAKDTFAELGIDFAQFTNSTSDFVPSMESTIRKMGMEPISRSYWADRWYYIDRLLAEGGIIGLSAHKIGPFTSYGHYMVITSKNSDGTYNIYTSSQPDQVRLVWRRSDFDGKLRGADYFFAKKSNN